MLKLHVIAAAAALLSAGMAAAQPVPQGATGELAARLLAAHNAARTTVGAPPLQWDQAWHGAMSPEQLVGM
jgi:uncharacterized protein YkwD